MSHSIVPTAESHLESLYYAFDAVARERKYLAFTEAPPWEQSVAFYRNVLANDFPHFVALQDDAVVGWCDVAPVFGHSRAHIGMLGVALLPQARHLGLGKRLVQAAIAKAWVRGLTRIELTVRADNMNAKTLYESVGFEPEGLHRRGNCIDGEYHDVWGMALLR